MASRTFKRTLTPAPITLGSGSDLNDCTSTGFYYLGASKTNLVNSPTGWAVMLVIGSPQSVVTQLIIRGATSTHGLYYRDLSGSPASWSTWKMIQGEEVT